ncbi:MAG: chorismate-binding protein [Okeania sp. SIO2F4]|uniref:chromophore lyase CpcT/CpeT n=1 Tax=Okeania sp. SIO2F4 TaxID=2607790 RepID=UPI00142BCC35|nr:chromophore lyase CpcT/CpeT [Okeania sp. SIO2F4]NES02602.1 chorismate-binding protein [Okeania sp. SIO2F4]
MNISQTKDKTNLNDLITLASWMAGDFSNQKQAFENPTLYAHIHVFFRPLADNFFPGIGFYSEQVYDYDLWSPYRQGVHQLIDKGDYIYIENYKLKDPILYAGAARELDILRTITPENIERRYNCSMVFKRDGDRFLGTVEPGNKCLIHKRGCQTYLVSEVELTKNTWVSLDKGMDINTHEQIWGSEAGHLKFEKQTSFANELPNTN